MPLLSVRDLHVSFLVEEGRIEALRGASFDVEAGRTLAVVGESGSGKTVVSQAIMGILPHNGRITRGQILFDDPLLRGPPVDLVPIPQDDPRRRALRGARISIIFQEPMSSLSPLHTIGDQIGEALALHARTNDGRDLRARTIEMLDRVGFPSPERAVDLYAFELSGGLRQRAMIAMALVCGPALLIADEPTTALDVTIQAQILKLMKDLQAEFGMAILFITHDLGVVANIATDMVVLYRGRVMERGRCEDLLRDPRHPYLKSLLGAVPRLRTPIDQPLAMLGRARHKVTELVARSAPPKPDGPADEPLLQARNLRKVFHTRRSRMLGGDHVEVLAVENVSFDVRRGECMAIVGESGSGKTTVAKMIMRALEPSGGSIVYRDEDGEVDILALDEAGLTAFRRKVQYVFQDPFGSLNPRMTVLDIVAEPLVIHGLGTAEQRRAKVQALIESVGLDTRSLRRFPHSFSGGQRQRIGIARALALGPRLLILDEPVSALDVSVQAQILNLLKDLQRELGLTYVFISHNLAVVRYLAQHVGVMCGGRMVELAPTAALFERPQHPYTRALLAAIPDPDPDSHLDFTALMAGRASDPRAWPPPYRLTGGSSRLRQVNEQHYVRIGE